MNQGTFCNDSFLLFTLLKLYDLKHRHNTLLHIFAHTYYILVNIFVWYIMRIRNLIKIGSEILTENKSKAGFLANDDFYHLLFFIEELQKGVTLIWEGFTPLKSNKAIITYYQLFRLCLIIIVLGFLVFGFAHNFQIYLLQFFLRLGRRYKSFLRFKE